MNMRATFINTMIDMAEKDERVFLVTIDMGYGVLEPFAEKFPDRFLNSGITEQASMSLSAGLAMAGYKVYCYSITPFVTMRCYEQVRLDVAYMNTDVKLIGVGAGFEYGVAGATHHAIEDISLMRSLPNMQVVCPGDNYEAEALMRETLTNDKPMYIRIGRNKEEFYYDKKPDIKFGKASIVEAGTGKAILTTSNALSMGKKITADLREKGENPSLISFHTIKPFDVEMVKKLIDDGAEIYTVEENNIIGGLGSAVAEVIAEYGKAVKFKRIGIPDEFTHCIGNQEFHRERYGLTKLNN